ncbi:MAG TPA: hypothetical protein VNI83_16175, partial [Vicinamibacterales bacterium]|nr:hypothetical protein [Vicinamibacterales bacterium]
LVVSPHEPGAEIRRDQQSEGRGADEPAELGWGWPEADHARCVPRRPPTALGEGILCSHES